MNEGLEEAYPDGELDEQGAEAADGVDAGLPVHLHGFLGDPLGVSLVLVPQLLHLGLKGGHGAHLPDLPEGQGSGEYADDDGEGNDGEAHVAEQHGVQEHQTVDHGPQDALIPDVGEEVG